MSGRRRNGPPAPSPLGAGAMTRFMRRGREEDPNEEEEAEEEDVDQGYDDADEDGEDYGDESYGRDEEDYSDGGGSRGSFGGASSYSQQQQPHAAEIVHLGLARPNTVPSLVAENRSFKGILAPAGGAAPASPAQLLVFPCARDGGIADGAADAGSSGSQRGPAQKQQTGASRQVFPQDNLVSFVAVESISHTRAAFISSTYSLFDNLQVVWAPFEKWRRQRGSANLAAARELRQSLSRLERDVGSTDDGEGPASSLTESPVQKEHLHKFSSLYRRELKQHVSRLLPDPRLPAVRQSVEEEASMFEAMHSIWYLCELTLMNSSPSSPVAEDLLLWLNSTYTRPTQSDHAALTTAGLGVPVHQRPQFWPYVTSCVLRGHFLSAATMLANLPNRSASARSAGASSPVKRTPARTGALGSKTPGKSSTADKVDAVSALTKLMQTMPRPSQHKNNAEFNARWLKWRAEATYHADPRVVSTLVGDGDPDGDLTANFQTLFSIIAGDQATILTQSLRWAEAVVALVIFNKPASGIRSVCEYLETVRELVDSGEAQHLPIDSTAVDEALAAAFTLDADAVIRASSRIDRWMVAHLTDLFDKYGKLEEVDGGEPLIVDASLQRVHERTGGDFADLDGDAMDFEDDDGMGASIQSDKDVEIRDAVHKDKALPIPSRFAIAASSSHWRIGVEYLARGGSSEQARGRLAGRLLHAVDPRAPGSAVSVRKVLALAKTHGLDYIAAEIRRIVAKSAMLHGRWGVAATEAAAAEDKVMCAAIADGMLAEHLVFYAEKSRTGQPTVSDRTDAAATLAIDELGEQTIKQYSGFAFLAKLRRFEKLFEAAVAPIDTAFEESPTSPDAWNDGNTVPDDASTTSRQKKRKKATYVSILANADDEVMQSDHDRGRSEKDASEAAPEPSLGPNEAKAVRWQRRQRAATALVELLTQGLAPRKMWASLLFDAVLLLEGGTAPASSASGAGAAESAVAVAAAPGGGDEVDPQRESADAKTAAAGGGTAATNPGGPVLGVDATFELMRCLEELVASHRRREYLVVDPPRAAAAAGVPSKRDDDDAMDVEAAPDGGNGDEADRRRRAEEAERAAREREAAVVKRLEVVRLALVRNLSRALLVR
ncbi:Nup85 nucleoporin-domain-containing protein [Zopfochytrium polystomum]|nr:Nup85 nucleoporin-domain-containing protein [Zopfochytrium polystomum]